PKELKKDSGWIIEKELKRIETEGKKFIKTEWYKRLYKVTIEELNNYVHTNPDYITDVIKKESNGTIIANFGANNPSKELFENALWRITEITLYTISVYDEIFKPIIKENMSPEFKQIIKDLNGWKRYYERHYVIKKLVKTPDYKKEV
ncbi:MAG TPA: hypothetical protein VHA74_00760, partial [Candidatus Dojkabacteria bacterium]|nr:hypothetical protein [Candidatus Dojkabacteria bacterium]